jgi:tyrosyl-tRNA synthetase
VTPSADPTDPPGAPAPGRALLDDLAARGLVHDSTDRDQLGARLDEGPITLYAGFDPTADSLHVGHLVPLLLLRRFQLAGHRPIALAGGATGMIGDPSGRSEERNLLDRDALDANTSAIKVQLGRFIDFAPGPAQAELVDNRDWTEPLSALEFLRDVGKHVTVGVMLAKDSVRSRLDGAGGLSYTEFSYMLLQANDFRWLHEHRGCELQVGGSDQWGNITAGIDLVRRTSGHHVHGLTVPLITRADGAKFGKTAEGAVWLDPARTSPYELYQYFVRTDDRDVERLLLQLTLVPVPEVQAIVAAHLPAPERRLAQRALAREVTALVHGPEAAAEAERASEGFTRASATLGADELAALAAEIPTTELPAGALDGGLELVAALVRTGLASSNGDARRAVAGRGVYVNDVQQGEERALSAEDLLHGRFVLLRRGKRQRHLLLVG